LRIWHDAHLLQQRQVVFQMPVLRDAAIHHVIQVEGLKTGRLALALHLAELAGEMPVKCSRTDTRAGSRGMRPVLEALASCD
jgi:hypothetical protein